MDRNSYLLKDVNSVIVGDYEKTRPVPRTFQLIGSTTSGTGSVSVDVEFSNDPTKSMWLLAGTITLTLGTTPTSDGFYSNAAWVYSRAKVTSISGTGASVSLIMGL